MDFIILYYNILNPTFGQIPISWGRGPYVSLHHPCQGWYFHTPKKKKKTDDIRCDELIHTYCKPRTILLEDNHATKSICFCITVKSSLSLFNPNAAPGRSGRPPLRLQPRTIASATARTIVRTNLFLDDDQVATTCVVGCKYGWWRRGAHRQRERLRDRLWLAVSRRQRLR